MRQTITKTVVDGLHPNNSEYTIWDEKLPGFGIRVGPSDAKSFIVVYRAGTGRTAPTKRYTIAAVGKMEPDQARNQAKILLGAIAGGSDPALRKSGLNGRGVIESSSMSWPGSISMNTRSPENRRGRTTKAI
jgi:hypothetical protein